VIEMGCEKWQEVIAMRLFGDLSREEEAGLDAHLEGCVDCRAVASEFAQTFKLLSYIDPEAVAATALVPTELTDRVLGELRRGAQQRRARRTRVISMAGVGLIAAAFILVALFSGSSTPAPTHRTLALRGMSSVSGTAVLSQKPWGTSLALNEKGLPGGTVYTVSMRTQEGTWWVAGTYRSVSGKPVSATMTCAVALSKIDGLQVTNSAGAVVLTSWNDTTPPS
jgi:predicted anti-sigma-YlaC factor YlaD